jgi:hypothetical protein
MALTFFPPVDLREMAENRAKTLSPFWRVHPRRDNFLRSALAAGESAAEQRKRSQKHPNILKEARRALKGDGRLFVFDADHAGTTYSQRDYGIARRVDYQLTSAIATHPDICRQLPLLLKMPGFELSRHHLEMISEC